jgi:predicted DNA-binding protein YlxM (UPF0122 family)
MEIPDNKILKENIIEPEEKIPEKPEEKLEIFATPYISLSTFPLERQFTIEKRHNNQLELPNIKKKLTFIKSKDFIEVYEQVIEEMKENFKIKSRKPKPSKKKTIRQKEVKRVKALHYYNKGYSYEEISKTIKMPRQNVRNIIERFHKTQDILKSKPGRKSKITLEHKFFIKDFYMKEENSHKTIQELLTELCNYFS